MQTADPLPENEMLGDQEWEKHLFILYTFLYFEFVTIRV